MQNQEQEQPPSDSTTSGYKWEEVHSRRNQLHLLYEKRAGEIAIENLYMKPMEIW